MIKVFVVSQDSQLVEELRLWFTDTVELLLADPRECSSQSSLLINSHLIIVCVADLECQAAVIDFVTTTDAPILVVGQPGYTVMQTERLKVLKSGSGAREIIRRLLLLAPIWESYIKTRIELKGVQANLLDLYISINNSRIKVTSKDSRVLQLLASDERYFTSDELARRIWSKDRETASQALKTSIKRLRKLLAPEYTIISKRRSGYRLQINPNAGSALCRPSVIPIKVGHY